MLSWVEHEKCFITLGPDLILYFQISMPHQWLEGNLTVSAKCSVCSKICGSVRKLQDWRCLWCKAMVGTPGFQVGPTFPFFPTFLIYSYFSLLFPENALLSILFHPKMSFTIKNPEIFPRSFRSLRFYKLTSMFIQGALRLTPKILLFNLKVSLFG